MWVRAHKNRPKIENFRKQLLTSKTFKNSSKGLKKICLGSFRGFLLENSPRTTSPKKSLFGPEVDFSENPSCFQVKIYGQSLRKSDFVATTTRKSAQNRNFQKALSRAKIPHKHQKRYFKDASCLFW